MIYLQTAERSLIENTWKKSERAFLKKLKVDCDEIYVFCSDDKNARSGIVALGGARCISVLSAFMRLNKDGNLSREEAETYIQAYLEELRKREQTTFRVYDTSKEMRMCRVPCEQVIEEMYSEKLEVLLNGNLRYK